MIEAYQFNVLKRSVIKNDKNNNNNKTYSYEKKICISLPCML